MCILCDSMKRNLIHRYKNVVHVRRVSSFGIGILPDYYGQTKEQFDADTDKMEATMEQRAEQEIADIGTKLADGYYNPSYGPGMTFPAGV